VGQTRVTLDAPHSIWALSWVVICAAKLLKLRFPTRLITQRSVVQIHPPQPTNLLCYSGFRLETPGAVLVCCDYVVICANFFDRFANHSARSSSRFRVLSPPERVTRYIQRERSGERVALALGPGLLQRLTKDLVRALRRMRWRLARSTERLRSSSRAVTKRSGGVS
jgi:hypothetical protein